jgi:hypothetical protein
MPISGCILVLSPELAGVRKRGADDAEVIVDVATYGSYNDN